MGTDTSLPGLERLVEVCRKELIPVEFGPPVQDIPQSGQRVVGLPFDSVLAAVYSRMGRAAFGGATEGIRLYPIGERASRLTEINEERRRRWSARFRTELFLFAVEPALAHFFATVPSLADGRGVQPVVWVDAYEELYALPVASDVDAFFDVYARYLERMRESDRSAAEITKDVAPDSLLADSSDILGLSVFPWDVPDLIARDEPLVEMLRAGRFDFLMKPNKETREWVGKVLAAST
jgi:hypothetical protein